MFHLVLQAETLCFVYCKEEVSHPLENCGFFYVWILKDPSVNKILMRLSILMEAYIKSVKVLSHPGHGIYIKVSVLDLYLRVNLQ